MLDKIRSNHFLRFDTFCFCLLCKKNIPEDVNLDKHDLIFTHLESEEHESNCRALFKLCFPDPCCESDDLKYVNIFRNLAFDVSWEIGNEVSYVCKTDNNYLRCLICEENISKVFEDKTKLELTLASHLESGFHINKVKSKASWIHHPSDNTYYIAFHKFFVFCSFCQKYLKSPKNTLLQVAADHITADLETIVKIKAIEEQRDNAIEDLCILFDFLNISDDLDNCNERENSLISDEEIYIDSQCQSNEPIEINECSNNPEGEVLDKENDLFLPSHEICEPSETPLTHNEETRGLKIIGVENVTSQVWQARLNQAVMIDLVNDNSVVKLNEMYIEIKNNRFFCKLCKVFTQFDENGNDLRKHLFGEHNDLLVKRASDFNSMMKYRDRPNNVTNKSEESENFHLILTKIALDKKFMSHSMFIKDNSDNFFCILCKDVVTFTTCGKYVENHFFQTDHLRKTYEISIDTAFEKKQQNQNSKTNRKSKKPKPQTDIKTLALFFDTNGLKRQPIVIAKVEEKNSNNTSKLDPEVRVIERRQLKVLRLASEENLEIRINAQFLIIHNENFFCTACQKLIIFVNSGLPLFKHCISQAHNSRLMKTATDYLVYNNIKSDCLKQAGSSDSTLHQFYELVDKITENDPYDVTASNILFLGITNRPTSSSTSVLWISCKLCNELIAFKTCAVEAHFLSVQHRRKTYELNCRSVMDSNAPYSIGDQAVGFEVDESSNNYFKGEQSQSTNEYHQTEYLSSEYELAVKKVLKTGDCTGQEVIESNKQYVELKNNTFFCIVCKVAISSRTIKAKKLKSIISHFNSKSHMKNMSKLVVAAKATTVKNNCSQNPIFLNVSETSGSKDSHGSNSENFLFKDLLHRVSMKYQEVLLNQMFISYTKNSFFCNICQEIQIFSENGSFLKIHCLSKGHNDILLKNALSFKIRSKDDLKTSSVEDKLILNEVLFVIRTKAPFDRITSHSEFLSVKNSNLFCILCRKQIKTTAKGNAVMMHFRSNIHRVKFYVLNCNSTSIVPSEHNLSIQTGNANMNSTPVTKASNSLDKGNEESSEKNNELLTMILKYLPNEFKEYGTKIELSEKKIRCKVCSFTLSLKRSLRGTLCTLQQHLSVHLFHETVSNNIELLLETEAFKSVSTEVQKCIINNLNCLEVRENALFCCICTVKLCIFRHGSQFHNSKQILMHLNSNDHRKHIGAVKC